MTSAYGKHHPLTCYALAAIICVFSVTGFAAESTNQPAGARPQSEADPAGALASFHLQPGFRLEVVAAAPLVAAPVAMAFDENGRLFVVERRGAAHRTGSPPPAGRIRLLEDTEGEGRFSASSLYADNLAAPSAVACYSGGVFVAAASELLYLKDVRAQGTADVRRVIFKGFGGTNALKPDALLNSFCWGPDYRIHGGTAGLGGVVTGLAGSGMAPVSLAGSDFSFEPRTLTLLPETGTAQSGLAYDERGRKFMSEFTRPLRTPMYEQRYAARNPFFPEAPPVLEVAGLAPGSFRLARGCLVYRGSAFPTNYLGNVFIADTAAHAVRRFRLRDQGLEAVALRPPGEAEFLSSEDPSFRPMQLVNGPDGALYIADLQEGDDSGRILRVVPENFTPRKAPQLRSAATFDLVSALAYPDGWRQDTAARLLYERRDAAAVGLLSNMLSHSRLPLARLQALSALDGLGELKEAHVLKGLRDTDERVRARAVLLSEKLFQGAVLPEAVWSRLQTMAADPSLQVQYQLAFTLGEVAHPARALALAELTTRNLENPWFTAAVLSSVSEGAGDLFVVLGRDAGFRGTPAGRDFLQRLATMIGVKGRQEEVAQVLGFLEQVPLPMPQPLVLLRGVGEGLRRTGSSLALVDPQGRLRGFYAQAFNMAGDLSLSVAWRVEALRLLAASPYGFADTAPLLMPMLSSPDPQPLKSAALTALGRYNDPRLTTNLLAVWPALGEALRREAVVALLSRSERVGAVLNAAERGQMRPPDLGPTQLNFLRTFPDPAIGERALRLFGPVPVQRPQAMQEFQPSLSLRGHVEAGRELFRSRCAGCHQPSAKEKPFGPELTALKASGKEELLKAILEPNAELTAGYATAVVETDQGENLIGLVEDANLKSLTLRLADGSRAVWAREAIRSLRTQTWSLMPEGIEQGLSTQDMANLLEYLRTTQR